jgi:hypothetical protein
MSNQAPPAPPIACTLGAGDFKKRMAWIAELNEAALVEDRRQDLTLELIYRAEARTQVLRMVRGEQECCGFLTFDVRQEPDFVRVTITAPETARDDAETVFEPLRSKAPSKRPQCGCCRGDNP